jgi:hypothetical protein
MLETECITAGITFGTMDSYAFNRRYNSISAGTAFQYPGPANIFTKFKSFWPGNLSVFKFPFHTVFTETITGTNLCRGSG